MSKKENVQRGLAPSGGLGDTVRTEMKCRICGGFSSAQTCWHCATNPGVQVLAAEVTNLRAALEKAQNEYENFPPAQSRKHPSETVGASKDGALVKLFTPNGKLRRGEND